MEIFIIIFSFFIVLGIVKKISDSSAKHEEEENLKYQFKKIEEQKNKISNLKDELRKEMIWFAFENKKIKSNKDDLPDQDDYQILSIDEIIKRNLTKDTNLLDTEQIYERGIVNKFPFPLSNDTNFTIPIDTIKNIQNEILKLPTKNQFSKICKVCEGRGVLVGCTNCGRGKFAIEKNEIGQEICRFCDTRQFIDFIHCDACDGRGKYKFR